MDEVQITKTDIRSDTINIITGIDDKKRKKKIAVIENRLFDFANFLEASITLLYMNSPYEVPSGNILRRTYDYNKIIVLPAFNPEDFSMNLMKVDDPRNDLLTGLRGVPEPDPKRCKTVPIDCIDIAIIPGIAFDEKGGRIGSGQGYYDRLIPNLPITTRKVALALEEQIVTQIPMESHDKHVDIIITDKRIIYKI